MRTRKFAIGIAVLAVLLGGLVAPRPTPTASKPPSCGGASSATGTSLDARPMKAIMLRRCLRLNQVQSLGSHNSYHGPTTPQILDVLRGLDPASADSLEYSHPPLPEQFQNEGIRQIELDVFADPAGGLYSKRVALDALGVPNPTPPELLQPGFKVLHIQDVDFNSTCLTFVACLDQVKSWSDAHPRHLPIAILVELKDDPIADPFNLGFVTPIPIDGPQLDAVDAEIRSVFSEDEMITPDDVRGSHPTLESAVLSGTGWPTLADSAGKVMFLMDNASKRDLYRAGRPSLEGRVLFTNATPGLARCGVRRDERPGRQHRRDPAAGARRATWCAPGPTPTRCRPARVTPPCAMPPSSAGPSGSAPTTRWPAARCGPTTSRRSPAATRAAATRSTPDRAAATTLLEPFRTGRR